MSLISRKSSEGEVLAVYSRIQMETDDLVETHRTLYMIRLPLELGLLGGVEVCDPLEVDKIGVHLNKHAV